MTPLPASRRRAVIAVAVAVGAVGFTTTAITVGTRGMAQELSLTTAQLGWVVNAYLVTAAALVLVGGRLGDVVGRVRTFAVGLGAFAVGSVIGVVSQGFAVLVVARVGQGIGAALILPSSIELIAQFSPRGTEGSGFRWRGLVYASSFAVGPLLGGVLTDWFSWRWVFALDAVLVAVAAVVALPLRNQPGRGTHAPTRDFAGAALVAVLVASVVLLSERVATWTPASARSMVTLGVALLSGAALVWHERRTEHPLVHPFILRDRTVLGANVATVGASLGMLSLLYFFNLFAQSAATLDHGAVSVIAALVPFVASMALCAVLAHWLGHRIGPQVPVVVGLLLMVAGFWMLSRTSSATTNADLVIPLALSGIGAGIANASLTSVAVLHLPAGRMNEAAGWISLSRFLGSAMALAVGTATFLAVTATVPSSDGVPGVAAVTTTVPPQDAFDIAAAALDRDLSGPLMAATEAATAERFARTMAVTAGTLAVITVVSWWLLRPKRRAGTPVPPSDARPPDASVA